MSDSGEQNYGERVRAGGRGRLRSPLVLSPGLAGLCGRAAGVWRRAGAGAPEGLMDAAPSRQGGRRRAVGLVPAATGFFFSSVRWGLGEIKNGRGVPSAVGDGSGI